MREGGLGSRKSPDTPTPPAAPSTPPPPVEMGGGGVLGRTGASLADVTPGCMFVCVHTQVPELDEVLARAL